MAYQIDLLRIKDYEYLKTYIPSLTGKKFITLADKYVKTWSRGMMMLTFRAEQFGDVLYAGGTLPWAVNNDCVTKLPMTENEFILSIWMD